MGKYSKNKNSKSSFLLSMFALFCISLLLLSSCLGECVDYSSSGDGSGDSPLDTNPETADELEEVLKSINISDGSMETWGISIKYSSNKAPTLDNFQVSVTFALYSSREATSASNTYKASAPRYSISTSTIDIFCSDFNGVSPEGSRTGWEQILYAATNLLGGSGPGTIRLEVTLTDSNGNFGAVLVFWYIYEPSGEFPDWDYWALRSVTVESYEQ